MVADSLIQESRRVFLALGAALALVGPTFAQAAANGASAGVASVTVTGPYTVESQPATGAHVALDRISKTVSLADLDLSTTAGAQAARQRIEAAAREVCDQVRQAAPDAVAVGRSCFLSAVREALARTDAAVGHPTAASE